MLKKLIEKIFKCSHKNAILKSDHGYCPDCGKYLKKVYYIVRCDCCSIKRFAKKHFDEIIPTEKYCTNCGSNKYIVEKYEKLNLVDINYAIEEKEVINEFEPINELEIWIENTENKETKKGTLNTPLITNLKYITG